ncbi:SRPBCC family protein [Cerasicoccus frondis]|uniref:SRPBCC family protein n=1 Tax=Cerasicoccus frondis TaxID=490090 RepID=UPI0028529886|nr:SRPBCC family protein [Cerasicoccus frondis]
MWHSIRTELKLDLPRDEVFAFFAQAENLEKITPRELGFRILSPLPIQMRQDVEIDYRIRLHGLPLRWRTLIPVWNPPYEFVDEQIKGPYKTWIHRHTFEELGPQQTNIIDYVRYELPFTPLGDLAFPLIRHQVESIFRHRNAVIPQLLVQQRATTK